MASNTAVHQFDPLTESFTSALAPSLGHVALFQGHLWFASSFTRTVEERNPQTLDVLVTQQLPMSITGNGGDWDAAITVTGHSVWIRSYLDDAVIRLDRSDRG